MLLTKLPILFTEKKQNQKKSSRGLLIYSSTPGQSLLYLKYFKKREPVLTVAIISNNNLNKKRS